MSHLALVTSSRYMLEIQSGPERGAQYQIVAGSVSLGRGSDNDIVLSYDPKCSRRHALITLDNGRIAVEDLTGKGRVEVNGAPIAGPTEILVNSIIKIGDTQICLKSSANALAHQKSGHSVLTSIDSPHGYSTATEPINPFATNKHQKARKTDTGKRNFYIMVLIIGGLFAWLLTETPNIKKIPELMTPEKIDDQLTESEKQVQQLLDDKENRKVDSPGFRQAQALFVKGHRDFQQGQFERAMTSFQACITLYPQHEKCTFYYSLAQKKVSELTQYYMVLGRKYLEQNHYRQCFSAFANALKMLRNNDSPMGREALLNWRLCKEKAEDIY